MLHEIFGLRPRLKVIAETDTFKSEMKQTPRYLLTAAAAAILALGSGCQKANTEYEQHSLYKRNAENREFSLLGGLYSSEKEAFAEIDETQLRLTSDELEGDTTNKSGDRYSVLFGLVNYTDY